MMMKSTIASSCDIPQSVYEDPDAPMPTVTDVSQPEVKVKPVPRPRSKIQPQSQCNNNNSTADSADTTSDTTNTVSSQLDGYPADYKMCRPVRPPPRPPLYSHKCTTSSKPTVDGDYYDITSISKPAETPPAVSTERVYSPTRPERPPLPSSYSRCSTMKLKPENCTDESQQSRCSYISSMHQPPASPADSDVNICGTMTINCKSDTDEDQQSKCSMQQPPVSPAVSESDTDEDQKSKCSMQQPPVSPAVAKEVNICRTYSTVNCKAPDRPEVPPRHGQTSPKTIPPPPSFTPPPPPPSARKLLDTVCSEIEQRPYLDVLPEDVEKMTLERSTIRYQTGCRTLTLQQTIDDTEDINGMLRWLKRVSKTDFMDLRVSGLGIEEEVRSFSQRAMNVRKALRLYNLLMMKRNESLRNIITEFSSISDSLDKLKKKGKAMEIAGGTTGAVGGMTAVLGIALAPMTFGTSLIATAIGAGMVASAGGIGAHNAKANKKIVNRMAVEKLVYEYKGNIVDLENCLSFILTGMNELRMHDIARLQRAGAQAEVLKVAHLSQSVFRNTMNKDSRTTVAHMGGMSSERLLLAFAKEMDQYFTEKDGLKLKKSNKGRFSVRVRLLAENLQYELYHLNKMWEMFG